jgi:hypothetical protein
MRVFSFGGGIQSTAALVLSAQRKLPYTHFVFSNVGDDSENPDTIAYIQEVAIPYAEEFGLQVIEVKRQVKDGKPQTLLQDAMQNKNSIPIPMYINGKPAKRICTSDWKINVVNKWMRENAGASKKSRQPIGVGISIDESHRMRSDDPERYPYTITEYPLVDMRLTRVDCRDIINKAGIPMAPKSSCWFCPFKKKLEWTEMRGTHPELFAKAIELEDITRKKHPEYQHVGLTPSKMPLDLAIPLESINMFKGDDTNWDFCESGYCMT